MLFEETTRTLLCSDLFHQLGDNEPLFHGSVLDRAEQSLASFQAGPLANYLPYSTQTEQILCGLADLEPSTFAVMHGSSFTADGRQALRDLNEMMRRLLSSPVGVR